MEEHFVSYVNACEAFGENKISGYIPSVLEYIP